MMTDYKVMLNPGVVLSLLVILSDFINVRATSDLRAKRSRGFPTLSGQECPEEEEFLCPQEECSFQEACQGTPRMLMGPGQFPPHMFRRQQESASPSLQGFNEESHQPQFPVPSPHSTQQCEQHQWRSPLPSGYREPQFSGGQAGERRGTTGMTQRFPAHPGSPPCQPQIPAFQRMPNSKSSRKGLLKFPQSPGALNHGLTNEGLHSPSRNKHVHKMPNDFPLEWGQHCTSQNEPLGAHHQPFEDQPNEPFRQDTCPTTTAKPFCFFHDFKPKYVETVPPPTCPISPAYEPPPKMQQQFQMSGQGCACARHPHHSFDHPSTEPRFVPPKQYQ